MAKIFLDAGHGSETSGKRTPDGYREHWINVMVCGFLETALKRCGHVVVKSAWNDSNAKNDSDIPILTRQKNCRASGSKISVSIHANAYGSEWNDAEGVITYYSSVTSKQKNSKKLAEAIQRNIVSGTKQKDRGLGMKDLGLCNANYMNVDGAVLVEIGFMTNKREAELMKTESFCREQAEDICKGICEYLGCKYVPATTTASSPVSSAPATAPASYPIYNIGKTYTLQKEMKVRKGHGTSYAALKHNELTASGQLHDSDLDGALDKGTVVTCKDSQLADGYMWIKTPSGWIAGYKVGGEVYVR